MFRAYIWKYKIKQRGVILETMSMECLAMNKPVITDDTPAIRELFEDGELMFVLKRADYVSFGVKAVMILKNKNEMGQT